VSTVEEIRRAIERVQGEVDDLLAQRTELTLLIAAHRRELDRLNRQLTAVKGVRCSGGC
jgi:Arc/MetJ family transcription regulator